MALICQGLAIRYDKRLAAWMAPFVGLMLVSAVYLRYHYVLDLVAELEGVEIREAASLLNDWFKLSRTAATRRPPRTVAPSEKRSASSTSATDV